MCQLTDALCARGLSAERAFCEASKLHFRALFGEDIEEVLWREWQLDPNLAEAVYNFDPENLP